VLLLNFVRMLITLIGLVIIDAFHTAYGLQGIGLATTLAVVLFIVFVISDLAEDLLLAHFNRGQED
jgi:hypothetical protein